MLLSVVSVPGMWDGLEGVDLVHLTQVCRGLASGCSFAQYLHPSRLVMTSLKLCTLCHSEMDTECLSVQTDWVHGWQACRRCRARMLFSNALWLTRQPTLGALYVRVMGRNPINDTSRSVRFYRRRTDAVQVAAMFIRYFSWLHWRRASRRIFVDCYWFQDGEEVGRMVSLSNLVVHNRDYFGHDPGAVTVRNMTETASEMWSRNIAREYHRARAFGLLLLCLRRCRIHPSIDVLKCVRHLWLSNV